MTHFFKFSQIRKKVFTPLILGLSLTGAAMSAPTSTPANAQDMSKLETNQKWLQNIQKSIKADPKDLMKSFEYVLSNLPDQVTVYPTENYYYFSFYAGGVRYAGNLRLAARERDQGIIHFAYFASANNSSRDGEMNYKALGKEDNVKVEKKGPLKYEVSYKKKTVIFNLNDVSKVEPPKKLLDKEEVYLGPVYDESGIQFYLVYNKQRKIFLYVLNEQSKVPDQLEPSQISDRLVIGRRTGFAFYKHHHIDRKILIGVHTANVAVNNYYDGPFDQLPDNFIKGNSLSDAIMESDPSVKGNIDRWGYLKSGEGRYLIGPYIQYQTQEQLLPFHQCATNKSVPREYYNGCFAIQGGGQKKQ